MATEVILPEVGEGIESGTVVSVLVKPGDTVQKDQPLVELETDKAVVEVPSTAAGVVKQVNVKEGVQAKVGSVLVVLEAAGEKAAESAAVKPAEKATEPVEPAPAKQPAKPAQPAAASAPVKSAAPASSSNGASGDDGRLVPAAPSVRRLARELGVDISQVNGSGILGRISAADVRAATGGAQGAPTTGTVVTAQPLPDFSRWGATERKAMSGIRKATLRAMVNAWATVPMVTHFDKADVTELERLRKSYQKQLPDGVKLTPTAILLKVVGSALKRFPDFNASVDAGAQEIVYKQYVNVGVAVDTDAGLLVPVVRDVDKKNMIDLAKDLGDLAAKARDRKLSLEEMQGGNFSISNLGGIGGHAFTPIVTPPEVAILGVSRSSVEGVWNENTKSFEPRTLMPLSLTYDHRIIDGASAARFLRWVCQALEEPFLLALEG